MIYDSIRALRRALTVGAFIAAAPANAQTPPPAPSAPASAESPAAPAGETLPAGSSAHSPAQVGYLFGLEFGEQMHHVGISNQLTLEDIARGLRDGLQGKKTTAEDRQQVQEFAHTTLLAAAAQNKTAGQEFLAHNAHEKGVKTTASGLQYKVLAPGDSKAAATSPTDEVTVQYRGKLLDGTEFDSSYAHGAPATFRANAVIKGWQEALLLMKPGAKWQLFVPAELAYDQSPRPGIPPGSMLIFDVELLKVAPGGVPKAPPVHTLPAPESPQ